MFWGKMPNYKTHMLGGFVFFVITAFIAGIYLVPNLQAQTLFQWLISALFGALFPDIDTKSKIQRFVYIILLALLVYFTYQNNSNLITALAFLMLIPLVVHHRGIFHRPIFIIVISLITASVIGATNSSLTFAAFSCAGFFALGALSHIFLDSGFKGLFRI